MSNVKIELGKTQPKTAFSDQELIAFKKKALA